MVVYELTPALITSQPVRSETISVKVSSSDLPSFDDGVTKKRYAHSVAPSPRSKSIFIVTDIHIWKFADRAAFAAALYYVVEKPARRRLRNVVTAPSPAVAAP